MWWGTPVNSALERWRQDQEFKIRDFNYIGSSKPAWTTRGIMSVKGVVERARRKPKHERAGETAQSVTCLLYKREKLSGLEISSTHVKRLGVIVHVPIIPLLRRQTGSLGLASGPVFPNLQTLGSVKGYLNN